MRLVAQRLHQGLHRRQARDRDEGADALTDELRRIGNNLNQLTRHANTGFVDVVDLRETRREVVRIWQLLNSLCQGAR